MTDEKMNMLNQDDLEKVTGGASVYDNMEPIPGSSLYVWRCPRCGKEISGEPSSLAMSATNHIMSHEN